MTGKKLLHLLIAIAVLMVPGITRDIRAQSRAGQRSKPGDQAQQVKRTTQADRKAAAAQRAVARKQPAAGQPGRLSAALSASAVFPAGLRPGGVPDYFNVGNYANSPLPVLDAGGNVVPGTGIRKFVDSLPGLTAANQNNLGQYIPIAVKDTASFPGSDYYQIALGDYTEKMHSDLAATTLRGYRDLAATGSDGLNHYLGPLIVAQRGRPVRVKFTDSLGIGSAGNLFIPVDPTIMGAGMGPDGVHSYTENRAVLHLHGGHTPWISDGTPHQWITPAGENTTPYLKGASQQNVPDMPNPGAGSATYFWSNDQSGRLMFYHDHSYGTTRLNVYAGEAAGYLIWDQAEEDLISGTNATGINAGLKKVIPDLGGVYHYGIPLIIQDKTFLPTTTPPAAGQVFSTANPTWGTTTGGQLAAQDPTWDTTRWGATPAGSLWFSHVYTPNQNPSDPGGANPFGRWDYGPWFWPPLTSTAGLVHGEVMGDGTNGCAVGVRCLGVPNPSLTPESFMDTPLVNGTAYPYTTVERRAYRFRILNAANDRSFHLAFYYADPANPTEVKMVPAVATAGFPANWPTDGRDGGVPDPATAGPDIIQIGNESGFLPNPVVFHSTPVGYEYDRRSITVLNVSTHGLVLGPAERADVIVDFSGVPAGATLILYNDSPAPYPAFDPRIDYYTGHPDMTDVGGAPPTIAGYGPNTRTVMQVRVSTAAPAAPFDLVALQAALPAAFNYDQPTPIVPETTNAGVAAGTYSRIQDTSLSTTGVTYPLQPKAIQELFELNYGRMNATLGVELPLTNFNTQTTIPLGYVDPVTETVTNGGTQLWKITHNGVDTHFIHFHLTDVQVINRIGWDGVVKPPDDNEVGWKETVRMNPLEDIVVALKPTVPGVLPSGTMPTSTRPLDPTSPTGSNIQLVDPATGNFITVPNNVTSFGWEYVWHCHILGHEENDMMRPVVFDPTPPAPGPTITSVSPASGGGGTVLTITGALFPSNAQVWVGGVRATAVTVNGAGTRITATAPLNPAGLVADIVVAAPGNVAAPEMQGLVPTPGAGTVTKSSAFAYVAAVTATAIAPVAGPVAGGTAVTITGTNFVSGLTTVVFGATPATSVAVTSSTSLSAVAPAHAAGSVNVIVNNGAAPATLTNAFTYYDVPTITTVTPATGPTYGGTVAVVSGTNFVAGNTTVTVGGSAATGVNVTSQSSVTLIVPPGPLGTVGMTLTTPGGTATTPTAFTYYTVPATTGVNPASGPVAGGTTISIVALGTTFVAGNTTVTIGGVAATSVNVTSATTLTCVTPPGIAGSQPIVVTTTPGPSVQLAGIGFTYVPAPTITAVGPTPLPPGGGSVLTITGTNFIPGNTVVTIGGSPATLVDVISPTTLQAVTPAGAGGAVSIVVTTVGGTATFTLSNAPTITSVTPTRGRTGGGTTITIVGAFFQSGATTVTVGGAAATSVTYINDTTVTAVTPPGRVGNAPIVVTTPGGTATAPVPFTYLAPAVDLNGDGIADAVTLNARTGAWSTLLGDATGNFTASAFAQTVGLAPSLGDFNGDGLTDLFWYNAATGAWTESINNGNGTFTDYTGTWSLTNAQLTLLDLNFDGKSDVFLYNPTTGAWVAAITTGAGTFGQTSGTIATGYQVLPGDFNGDGYGDLFFYDPIGGVWAQAITSTPGSFTFTTSPARQRMNLMSWTGWQVVVVDLNGDHKSDLFLYNPSSGAWAECLNDGAGGFTVQFGQWSPGWHASKADLNGDGNDDLLMYNSTTGAWAEYTRTSAGGYLSYTGTWTAGLQVAVADVDGDGCADAVLYDPGTGQYTVAFNTAIGSFRNVSGAWQTGLTVFASR